VSGSSASADWVAARVVTVTPPSGRPAGTAPPAVFSQ
jgi:hypothetical protein